MDGSISAVRDGSAWLAADHRGHQHVDQVWLYRLPAEDLIVKDDRDTVTMICWRSGVHLGVPVLERVRDKRGRPSQTAGKS